MPPAGLFGLLIAIAAGLAAGIEVWIEIGRAFGIDVGMSFGLARVVEFALVVGRSDSATPAVRPRLTWTKIAFGLAPLVPADGRSATGHLLNTC